MIRCLLLFGLLCCTATAWADVATLERVANAYAEAQPGLLSYQTQVQTAKVGEMIEQMTANLPPDAPRPKPPLLVKYWSRQAGRSLIRAEGGNVFPMMQEMVRRFSREFALDPGSLFLPRRGLPLRSQLLKSATVKAFETRLADARTLSVSISFAEPSILAEAFYSAGLGLPQSGIRALTFDLDPDQAIVKRLEIIPAEGPQISVEIRHQRFDDQLLPQELRITTPDGSIDDRFVTSFAKLQNYWLPKEQVRTLRRLGREEVQRVSFGDYRINGELPEAIHRELDAAPGPN